jgi:hypothetical protein
MPEKGAGPWAKWKFFCNCNHRYYGAGIQMKNDEERRI